MSPSGGADWNFPSYLGPRGQEDFESCFQMCLVDHGAEPCSSPLLSRESVPVAQSACVFPRLSGQHQSVQSDWLHLILCFLYCLFCSLHQLLWRRINFYLGSHFRTKRNVTRNQKTFCSNKFIFLA